MAITIGGPFRLNQELGNKRPVGAFFQELATSLVLGDSEQKFKVPCVQKHRQCAAEIAQEVHAQVGAHLKTGDMLVNGDVLQKAATACVSAAGRLAAAAMSDKEGLKKKLVEQIVTEVKRG